MSTEPLFQSELKQILTLCPENPTRTIALESRIKIGTGYHSKWYRSQREHWLGWIVRQEFIAVENGKDIATIRARTRWSGLNCIPMMFWLAEAVGLPGEFLDQAEAVAVSLAEVKPHDCPEHGKGIRQVLSWDMIEERLRVMPRASVEETTQAGLTAFGHLANVKPKYRRYLDPPPEDQWS